jgi:hypothetical protein
MEIAQSRVRLYHAWRIQVVGTFCDADHQKIHQRLAHLLEAIIDDSCQQQEAGLVACEIHTQ